MDAYKIKRVKSAEYVTDYKAFYDAKALTHVVEVEYYDEDYKQPLSFDKKLATAVVSVFNSTFSDDKYKVVPYYE